MKRSLILFYFLSIICGVAAFGQVTFIVQSLPSNTPEGDSLYIAGNFTGWEPGVPEYMLHKNNAGKWSITLPGQAAGTVIKFKFTRGSWATVEKGPAGEEITDRTYTFGSNDSIDVIIYNWADGGGGSNSTAADNVKIISSDFYMPQLDRTRRIWMYFPPDYESSGMRYPVLYMHDGQNLFDAATSFAGEWEVDETLNTLAAEGKHVPLVVGIDNGGNNRIDEYTPWPNPQYGGGDGDKYIRFIIETLKPYIDQHYRTFPDRENTGIMGSSIGGLISHYGSLKYPDIFSKAGLFSPSYWFSDSVWKFTHDNNIQYNMLFYQLCGTNESTSMVPDLHRMSDSLINTGFAENEIFEKIVSGGQHNEKLWREGFKEAYSWLFNDYVSTINETRPIRLISCYPNPVNDILHLVMEEKIIFDSVMIFDMNGSYVKTILSSNERIIDVSKLSPGSYIVKCYSNGTIMQGNFLKK